MSIFKLNLHFISDDCQFPTEETIQWELGQRLGTKYQRTLQDYIEIIVNEEKVSIYQCSLGCLAISGVVWDAGLLLVDILIHLYNRNIVIQPCVHNSMISDDRKKLISNIFTSFKFGKTLDLGTGTGIVGVIIENLIKQRGNNDQDIVFYTDCHCTCKENINVEKQFILYDWKNPIIPDLLLNPHWDTIVASDILYDIKDETYLMDLLGKLSFSKFILSYKRRHDDYERLVFDRLKKICDVYSIELDDFPLLNCELSSLNGLSLLLLLKK